MPLYDIEHHTPIPPSQQSAVAIALTNLHTKTFHTPRFFINVRFTPLAENKITTFRGGERATYNRAILRTRASGSRSVELYNTHCHNVVRIWEAVMGLETQEQKLGENGLRTVWVLGALTTAVELGVERPMVGEEGEWLQKNRERFEDLAKAGDKDMKALVSEEFGIAI
jgi:hypothetical protein